MTTHNDSPPHHGSAAPVVDGRLTEFAEDPIACMRRLHARHGDLVALREGDQQIVFAIGPEWNQRILTDGNTYHSRFFAVRGSRRSAQRRVTSGLLSMNGNEHKQHRRIVMEPFQKRSISAYQEFIGRLATEMLDSWQPGEVRDINAEMTQFMLRLTSSILFGVDMPEVAYDLGLKIEHWTHMNHQTGLGAFVSDPVFNERYEVLMELAEELEQGVAGLIERRKSSGQLGHDVLSLLLKAHENGEEVSVEQLVGHVTLLFGAAHLTTAHTFTWTLFLLAQHPEVILELHSELEQVLSGVAPDGDSLAQLETTERILKESMRVLPASSYSQRINIEPVDLNGIHLRAGTPVIFSQFMTHHLPRLYQDPDHFLPSRWHTITPSAYAFLPFGAGPRMCIGAPLAMMILKTVLPMILQRFRLSVVPDQEINSRVISTMLGPTTPVLMQIHEQDQRHQAFPVRGNIHELVHLAPELNSDHLTASRAA